MNKLYKSSFLTICLLLGFGLFCANAQETDPNSKFEKAKKQEKTLILKVVLLYFATYFNKPLIISLCLALQKE